VPASSPLSAVDLLEGVDLEIALGEDALELGVLALQAPEPFDVGGIESAEVTTPVVDRLLADLVLPRDLRDRRLVSLAQDRDHLLFGETGFLHGLLASSGSHSLKLRLVRRTWAGQDFMRVEYFMVSAPRERDQILSLIRPAASRRIARPTQTSVRVVFGQKLYCGRRTAG